MYRRIQRTSQNDFVWSLHKLVPVFVVCRVRVPRGALPFDTELAVVQDHFGGPSFALQMETHIAVHTFTSFCAWPGWPSAHRPAWKLALQLNKGPQ